MHSTDASMQLLLEDGIHILNLNNGDNDNLLTQSVLEEYQSALDTVASFKGNTALMITCDHDKTWCNGIDLEWLMAQPADGIQLFTDTLEQVAYRLTMLDAPTLACVNGNCYAGGAILYAACDFRVMRQDKGRVCYPEIDIKIPFTDMMHDIISGLPNHQMLKRMTLLGDKITGQEAYEQGICDAIFPAEQLQAEARAMAKKLAQKDRPTYANIKRGLKRTMLQWEARFAQ